MTPERESVPEDNDDDGYVDEFLEEEANRHGRDNVRPPTSPYIMPYVYKRRLLYTQYENRKEGDI